MTKVRRPYSRVYWEALDDPKFATVWDDDRALAAWLRLLVAADMAWPASASLYHGVNRAALAKLCDVGLVDMQAAGRYRIHGLDKERAARARQASDAAAARWDDDEPPHPAGNAAGMRPHPPSNPGRMPSRDEQSKDEQRRDETSKSNGARTPADAFDVMLLVEDLTRAGFDYREGHRIHDTLVADVANHGADVIAERYRAFRATSPGPIDAAQLVFGVHNALHPLVKAAPPRPETPAEYAERKNREAKEARDAVA